MCVAYPMQITAIADDQATITFEGTEQEVSLALLEDAQVGDYVIVHAGFALQKLSVEEAEETIKLFDELTEAPPDGNEGGDGA